MAKKKTKNKRLSLNPVCRKMTLREENVGRSHVSVSSMLKMEHLQNIATWASGEPSLPGLAALFGRQLASNVEASGISLDRSLVFCQRSPTSINISKPLQCEILLQPGDNCTIRIEKNATKARRNKNKASPPQNNVVYTCHFCSHRNVHRGTSQGHMKELASRASTIPAAPAHAAESESPDPKEESAEETEINVHVDGMGNISVTSRERTEPRSVGIIKGMTTSNEIPATDSPITPSDALSIKKGAKGGSGATKPAGSRPSSAATGSTNCSRGSSKRKRKGWSSLKDIVESNEQVNKRNISSLVIPFRL